MDDTFFIPMKRFRAVVQEVAADIKRGAPSHFEGEYRWEGDALICLQTMTEHVLLMVFELWYFLFSMYTDQALGVGGALFVVSVFTWPCK